MLLEHILGLSSQEVLHARLGVLHSPLDIGAEPELVELVIG